MACFDRIEATGGINANRWYHLTLREGRNREVRRLFEAVGITVSRLMRIGYGPIELGRMKRGSYRLLDEDERAALYAAVRIRPAVRQ